MIRFCYTGGTFDSVEMLMSSGEANLCTFDSSLTTFDSTVRTFDATTCQEDSASEVRIVNVGAGVDVPSWEQAVQAKFDALNAQLEVEVKKERILSRQIVSARKTAQRAARPEGILANMHMLEMQKQEMRKGIKELRLQIKWAKLDFEDPDEDDEEILLLQ